VQLRRIESLERRILLTTLTVTSPADTGPGTLREAILSANASPGADTIAFDLPVPASIAPLTPLPDITGPTTIDGTTQPAATDVDPAAAGPRVRLVPAYQTQNDTLRLVNAGGSVVRGLEIAGSLSAIHVLGGSDVIIEGNRIGALDAPFTTGTGILLEGATDCTVGGTTPARRNVIAGNYGGGVVIKPDASVPLAVAAPANHRVVGNYIGTDSAGDALVGSNYYGVLVSHTTGTIVGGAEAGARNVIGGNYAGVFVQDGQATVRGNYLGVDVSGKKALPNKYGVWVEARYGAATGNVVGGSLPGEGNVISGSETGVFFFRDSLPLQGAVLADNVVAGNLIGLDANGLDAVPNSGSGVVVGNGSRTVIGGDTPAARNVISANAVDGVLLQGDHNVVRNNYIGTDVFGRRAFGNGFRALNDGGTGIRGGTSPDAEISDNLISGNRLGIYARGVGTVIRRNLIGTDPSGTQPLPNTVGGIDVGAGIDLGGPTPDLGNVIAGNGGFGVSSGGTAGFPVNTDPTFIRNNRIGVAADGSPLGNAGPGVVTYFATLVTVTQNAIANNGGAGVLVREGSSSVGVLANSIHSNKGLGIDLAPGRDTPTTGVTGNDPLGGDADTGPNGLQNFPVLTTLGASDTRSYVQGYVTGPVGTTLHVELFSSPTADPSGYGEGATFIGSTDVATDAAGRAGFTVASLPPLPAGSVVTATASRTSGLPAGSAETSEFSAAAVVPTHINTGPRVTGVFVRGRTWSFAFRKDLLGHASGSQQFGFPLPADRPLPWANIDQVSVRFSEDIAAAGVEDLLLQRGAGFGFVGAAMNYDPTTRTITWTLAAPIGAHDVAMLVRDRVTGLYGGALDGERSSDGSYPSGDGTAGGDFELPLAVLPGDATRDGRVDAADVAEVRRRYGATLASGSPAAYSAFCDFNGDGKISPTDVVEVRRHVGDQFPAPPPSAQSVAAPAPSRRTRPAARDLLA
jgi:hypothetical protein